MWSKDGRKAAGTRSLWPIRTTPFPELYRNSDMFSYLRHVSSAPSGRKRGLPSEEILTFDFDAPTALTETPTMTWLDYIGSDPVDRLLTKLRTLEGQGEIRLVFELF